MDRGRYAGRLPEAAGREGGSCLRIHAIVPRAIPQYTIGYGRFRQWIADTEQSMRGVFFAGNYRNGISVADTIGSGLSAARRLAESLDG